MRKKLQNVMFELSYMFELFISFIVGAAVVIFGVRLIADMAEVVLGKCDNVTLVTIFDDAIILAIGAELIKMLCKHTPETVIEVLAFALARQLIIGHCEPWECFVMVISIAALFAVRRFLLKRHDQVETPDGFIEADETDTVK